MKSRCAKGEIMMKERMMAILIGGLMLFSVAGFALMGVGRFADNGNQAPQVPTIMKEYLTGEQISSILRTGRVLIRDVYTVDCVDCKSNDATLEIFANSFSGLVVLEEIMVEPDNETTVDGNGYVKFEMISPTGDIIELADKEINQENLTDMFCEISAIQPKECLLRSITNQQPAIQPLDQNKTNANETGNDIDEVNVSISDNDTIGDGITNKSDVIGTGNDTNSS